MLLGEQRQRAAVDRVLSEDLQRFIFHHLLIIHRQMTSLFLLLLFLFPFPFIFISFYFFFMTLFCRTQQFIRSSYQGAGQDGFEVAAFHR